MCLSSFLFRARAYCIRCAVCVSFACRKCASERQRVLLPRMKLDSRGLPGVNWGVMWFVLLPLPAALPSTLNQIPSDYSLMASVTSVCFKQPTTAKDKMTMCAFYDHLHSIFKVPLQFVLKRTGLKHNNQKGDDNICNWCSCIFVCLHNNVTNKLLGVASTFVREKELNSKKLYLEEARYTI